MIELVSALALVLAPTEASPPVPVQRPAAMETESEPESESESESESEPESEPEPEPELESEPAPASKVAGTATITGYLVDTEVAGAPLPRTQVEAVCTCLSEPRISFTDAQGRFEFEDLPAGVYTIVATRGGRPTHEVVAVADGDDAIAQLLVGPPTTTAAIDEREAVRQRANTMIAVGGVAGIGGLVMLLAAAIEQRKPDCKFGLDDCADKPRSTAMIGLGVGGGILALASAALIGVGVHRIRKLNARISVDDRSAAITISGRF